MLDTSSANELELLSNGQIQAAALATNALLNDKIDRVVYTFTPISTRIATFSTIPSLACSPARPPERHFDVRVDQELIQRHEYRLEDAHREYG